MKTNPLTSRLRNLYLYLAKHRKMPGCAPVYPDKSGTRRGFLFTIAAILLFLLLLSLTSCKSPATLTNDTQHRTRDSTYHATVHRIETHDTIVLGLPLHYHKKYCRDSNGKAVLEPFAGGNLLPDYLPLIRISDRTITLHDTVYICRTDTLIRTQTITEKERYIPPFYRFCTITLITLITLVTLAFSIRLLLRYLKIRSPT